MNTARPQHRPSNRSRSGEAGCTPEFPTDLRSKNREQFRGTPSQAKTGPKTQGRSYPARDRCLACQSAGKPQNSCRFGVHSEDLGYVYFLY